MENLLTCWGKGTGSLLLIPLWIVVLNYLEKIAQIKVFSFSRPDWCPLPFQVSRFFNSCQTKFQIDVSLNFLGLLGSTIAMPQLCTFRENHWSYWHWSFGLSSTIVFLIVLCSQQSSKCCLRMMFRFLRLNGHPALLLGFTLHLCDLYFVPSHLSSFT